MTFIKHLFYIIKTIVRPKNWIAALDYKSKKELLKILMSKNRYTKKLVRQPLYLNMKKGGEPVEYFNRLKRAFILPPYNFSYEGQMDARTQKGFNHELEEIITLNIYEHNNVILREADVVLDCGANIGIFSIMAAKKIGPKGTVYAFEPGKREINSIRKNLITNDVKNVIAVELGIWSKRDNFMFILDHSWANYISEAANHNPNIEQVRIETTSIDDFVASNNIEKVDFIKMDIEGAEYHAIIGARETLRRFQPRLAISLYHHSNDYLILPRLVREANSNYQVHIKNVAGVLMMYAS